MMTVMWAVLIAVFLMEWKGVERSEVRNNSRCPNSVVWNTAPLRKWFDKNEWLCGQLVLQFCLFCQGAGCLAKCDPCSCVVSISKACRAYHILRHHHCVVSFHGLLKQIKCLVFALPECESIWFFNMNSFVEMVWGDRGWVGGCLFFGLHCSICRTDYKLSIWLLICTVLLKCYGERLGGWVGVCFLVDIVASVEQTTNWVFDF